jgi:hypothetical protein
MVLAEFHGNIPEGVTIHVPPVRRYRDAFLNSVPWVEITIVIGAVANLVTVADFIWRKFGEGKKPVEKVTINRREEIKWTREELTRVIDEKITKESKGDVS